MFCVCFSRDGSKNTDIYVIDVDKDDLRNLTNSPALDESPSWSPDGQSIAFASNRDGNLEIYIMNADGGNLRRLTNNPGSDESPSWSSDGQRITFVVSGLDGGKNNGGKLPPDDGGKPLPDDGNKDDKPGDDGFKDSEIYVMDADGSNPRNLTNHPGPDSQPDWLIPSGHPVTPSGASAGKLRTTWGWLKQNNE